MAVEIVPTVAITGAITLAGTWITGRITAAKAKDDHDREIKKEILRRRVELRQENLRPLREGIEQTTIIIDRFLIARQGALSGDPGAVTDAAAASIALKEVREKAGPHPWWTVPDEQLDKLCRTFYADIGNLELTLVSSRYAELHGLANSTSDELF